METDEFEAFLAGYSPAVQQMACAARQLILDMVAGAIEMVDPPSRIVAYGYSRRYADLVAAVAPQQEYVNLMFSRGAELDDPHGLLHGTGKKARHARIAVLEDLEHPGLRNLLEQTIHLVQGKSELKDQTPE